MTIAELCLGLALTPPSYLVGWLGGKAAKWAWANRAQQRIAITGRDDNPEYCPVCYDPRHRGECSEIGSIASATREEAEHLIQMYRSLATSSKNYTNTYIEWGHGKDRGCERWDN